MKKLPVNHEKTVQTFLRYFNWKGDKIIVPVPTTSGYRMAAIYLEDLVKIIKYEK